MSKSLAVVLVLAGIALGSIAQSWRDHAALTEARQNEMQAKATLAHIVEMAANDPNNPDNEREEVDDAQ